MLLYRYKHTHHQRLFFNTSSCDLINRLSVSLKAWKLLSNRFTSRIFMNVSDLRAALVRHVLCCPAGSLTQWLVAVVVMKISNVILSKVVVYNSAFDQVQLVK